MIKFDFKVKVFKRRKKRNIGYRRDTRWSMATNNNRQLIKMDRQENIIAD